MQAHLPRTGGMGRGADLPGKSQAYRRRCWSPRPCRPPRLPLASWFGRIFTSHTKQETMGEETGKDQGWRVNIRAQTVLHTDESCLACVGLRFVCCAVCVSQTTKPGGSTVSRRTAYFQVEKRDAVIVRVNTQGVRSISKLKHSTAPQQEERQCRKTRVVCCCWCVLRYQVFNDSIAP